MTQWTDESDAVDFESSALKCVMRRGPGGHWCGYVAVDSAHPWHGKSYSDSVKVPQSVIDRDIDIDKVGAINLFCAAGKEEELAAGLIDIVLAVDVHGGLTYSSDTAPHDSSKGLWWFGFDCAHAGDLSPKYIEHFSCVGEVYRDEPYVKSECEYLALQLSAVAENGS